MSDLDNKPAMDLLNSWLNCNEEEAQEHKETFRVILEAMPHKFADRPLRAYVDNNNLIVPMPDQF